MFSAFGYSGYVSAEGIPFFQNKDDSMLDTVKDIDGNVYKTVKIGSQVWMAENLKTTRYNDGTEIPYESDEKDWKNLSTDSYCCFWNIKTNRTVARFGLLYNWYAVNTGKLAPFGWHVPTAAEWEILEKYLIANGYNYDGTTAGNKIAKSLAATTDWPVPVTSKSGTIGDHKDKNNRSGFTALPGGLRGSNGLFSSLKPSSFSCGQDCSWWSSSEFNADEALNLYLTFNSSSMDGFHAKKNCGFSVRCVRDLPSQ